jgi:hypothetical protein
MTSTEGTEQPATVKVVNYSGATRDLPAEAEATVQYYLNAAEVEVTQDVSVSLNGEPITDFRQVVEPGSVLVVAPNISNG